MSADFESPFLDRDTPLWSRDDERENPPDLESPFDNMLEEAESPFLAGEVDEESPFLTGETVDASYESSDPSLFDPRELESESTPEWESLLPDESQEGEGSSYEYSSNDNGTEQLEGEIIVLKREAEYGEPDQEAAIFAHEDYPERESELPADETIPMISRILWPALGFPAVVTPSANPKAEPSFDVDATRCLTLLVLTNYPKLPPAEAAKRLRIVPWSERGRRFIPEGKTGAFLPSEIAVRTDSPAPKLVMAQPKDATEQLIAFGGGAGRVNTIIVNLAKKVRDIYAGWGMKYLHEIRISEAATARLGAINDGRYHLFFNNLKTVENAPSDEMALLISLGVRRRAEEANPRIAQQLPDAREEYEYEFGAVHKPYSAKRAKKRRNEVLHPVFIRKTSSPRLQLGHITDLHVDVRNDVYQHNLEKKGKIAGVSWNNWNDAVSQIYAFAKRDVDAILLTGDLIDYGRGHAGVDYASRLGDNDFYHRDRNWLLFYDVFAAEDRYTVPLYTSLGNHDWRINPYTPFAAAGAPGASTFVNDYDCFSATQLRSFLEEAHGDGHQLQFSYDPRWKTLDLVDIIKTLGVGLRQDVKLEKPGLPTETNIDSVLWYLLTINPFLDYLWALPSKHQMLMLDWAEDEGILFPTIDKGKDFPYLPTPGGLSEAADAGPRALRVLTSSQKLMVEYFVKLKSPAKVIGIHVPPIGPWYDWGEDDLKTGYKRYKKRKTRGPTNYAIRKDGKVTPLNGHPIFAITPKKGPDGNRLGMTADYNSFMRDREWFIRTLANPAANVRMVLSGHIHRNGIYAIRVGNKADGAMVEGEYLVRGVAHDEIQGTKTPNVSHLTKDLRAPLYVNTTSAGPRGNYYPTEGQHLSIDPGYARIELMADGVISRVSFRRPVNAKKAACDIGAARNKKGLPAFASV